MAKDSPHGVSQPANLNRAVLIECPLMPRPRARLDSAGVTRAFAPDGLHGATSVAIARCAGVAKPTVYAHGGSKEAVFLACVEAEVEHMLGEISQADLQTRSFPARARITALAEAIIEHGRVNPAAARLLHVTARHTASGVASDVDAARRASTAGNAAKGAASVIRTSRAGSVSRERASSMRRRWLQRLRCAAAT